MEEFDYIILGGGLSGTVLALTILNSPLKNKKILIIEKEKGKYPYQRQWSYWINHPHILSKIVQKSWKKFQVTGKNYSKTYSLNSYNFEFIDSKDLFNYSNNFFKKFPNLKIIQEDVKKIESEKGFAKVYFGESGIALGKFVFDSIIKIEEYKKSPRGVSQGIGWVIEAKNKKAFDPNVLTLFDFRLHDKELGFYYILPFSKSKAVIVDTHFAAPNSKFNLKSSQANLEKYLKELLGIKKYKIISSSFNRIPLSTNIYKRKLQDNVMTIGLKGGMLKSTTSYALTNILEDSEKIVRSLLENGHPFYTNNNSGFYPLVDNMFLKLMTGNPGLIKRFYENIFSQEINFDLVFGFLNGKNKLAENYQLLKNIFIPTLRALLNIKSN